MSSLTQPQKTIGISLKLYFSLIQTSTYLTSILPLASLAHTHNIHLFIIPSLLSLPSSSLLLTRTSPEPTISLGAQDCFWEDSGAYTGEVSPTELEELGCSLVELGHAERRRLFNETDEDVAKKAQAVVRNGMIPLICIGEKSSSSISDAVAECRPQIESILSLPQVKGNPNQEIIFAYEPVWAIGQPAPASAEYVVGVVQALRGICSEEHGRKSGIRFLYGGSAGPGTFEAMREAVDGLFLGRFAHDVENLRKVIEEVAAASKA
ncbi:triosephosphate isomerase-like protein [Tricladium varicosporioides]|nr:triosephosphate isomerase-like protein [Hymenoscyphus varicosporioides]